MSVWQILNEQNPWWRDKSSIDRNFYVKTWLDSKIKWVCSSFDVSWGNRVIYIIKGPRQVGKSTGIILKIRDLLKEGIDPYSILYLHCEAFSSRKELEAALRNFLRSSNGKKWIFLDEVTHIKDWYISIKYFLDIGLLNNATIISTGSSSLDLARASSYLAGRKGEIKGIETDRVVLPMRFSDAIWFLVKSLPKWLSNELKRRILIAKILRGELPPEIRKLLTYWEEIEQALDKYILTGGYPLSMDKYLKKNKIPSSIYNMFITLVRRDLEREGYDPYKIDQVIKKLIDTLTTPISLEKIKSGTDIRSTTRLSDYISALQASYVITQIPFMDPQKKSIIPRKERKYYFRDPFIYHALRSWIQGVDPFESARILLAEH
ncbi:MAG: ATP-binding protein, partial [Candidatus Njordarchaeota archaeon]